MYMSDSELESLICTRSFSFGRIDGPVFAPRLSFRQDYSIFGYKHDNEHKWSVRNGSLLFHSVDENITTWFDDIKIDRTGMVIRGRIGSETSPHMHILHEITSHKNFASIVDTSQSVEKPENDVVVLIRSHLCDNKFADVMSKLEKNCSGFDVFALIDESNGRPDNAPSKVVWHSIASCYNLGLTQMGKMQSTLYWCGDFPLYAALRQLPNYKYYIMIEDDVEFRFCAGSFIQSIISALMSQNLQVDLVGINYKPDPNGTWTPPCEKAYGIQNCYYMTFPFIIASKPLVSYLFSQRLLEAARGIVLDDVINCEAFAVSAAVSGGFRCKDLNSIVPGSYNETMMMHSGQLGFGKPLGYIPSNNHNVSIYHPIYSHAEFVKRIKNKFSRLNPDRLLVKTEVMTLVDTYISDLDMRHQLSVLFD